MSSSFSSNNSGFVNVNIKTEQISNPNIKVEPIPINSMCSSQQDYMHVFKDARYTKQEKIEMLNKAIENSHCIKKLIKYHIDRAVINFALGQWQNVLRDIDFVERYEKLDKSMEKIKWKSMIQFPISEVRKQVLRSMDEEPNNIDDNIEFLNCITQQKTDQFLESNIKKRSSKIKRLTK